MDLTELKKQYKSFAEKQNLPLFKTINEAFEIDRIERDTDCLPREVRKIMMDKILGYIRLIEMIINPSQAPPMFMAFVKEVSAEDRKGIERAYKKCIELELSALSLEVEYDEKAEARVIQKIFDNWKEMRDDLKSIIAMMERNWHAQGRKKEKAYFG